LISTTIPEHLDADELLHLALRAADQNRHEEAITLLKRALALAPGDARLHYMLGAEHAQIGMYERASEEMSAAVELDPSLNTAHFQLGLLHLTSGRVPQAERAWKPLDALEPNNYLRLLKTGLEHLARDEFSESADFLRRGIAANQVNATLNVDMQRLLQTVEEKIGSATASPTSAKPAGAPVTPAPLSAYRRNRADGQD